MLLTLFNTQLAAFGRYARRSSRPSAATLTVRNTLTSPTHMPPVSTLGHIELCVEQISYLLWVSTPPPALLRLGLGLAGAGGSRPVV